MYLCSVCGVKTQNGNYTNKNLFVCVSCIPFFENYHFDTYQIIAGEVKIISPFCDCNEKEQRFKFIDYCYKIFDNKLSKATYSLINTYLKKGYSFLGMIQAIEYFYVIKKNSTKKSKNSIGIIPFIYEEAQNYYKLINKRNYKKYKLNYEQSKIQVTETIISTSETKKDNLYDMTLL